MNRDHSVVLRFHPSTAFLTLLLTMRNGNSISSKGFLPTIVDTMVIWVKFTHSSPFSSLIPRISTFTLAISCLTMSNLPWFMDLTFQVPMQYCSLQHRTLLLSTVTSRTGYCSCFGSISSFFMELFLHWSPVAYWAPTDLGSSSFSILSFCLFILFMGFSRQEYWSGLFTLEHVIVFDLRYKTQEWKYSNCVPWRHMCLKGLGCFKGEKNVIINIPYKHLKALRNM